MNKKYYNSIQEMVQVKTVKLSYENIDLNIPRDRELFFEQKMYGKDISNIENQMISMYAKGIS